MGTSLSIERYLELNGKYLREAEESLARGDLVQASEKLWGAASEIVKAVAAKRGLELGTHASLWEYISKLNRERPEWGLIDAFAYAGILHTNFYEGWLTEDYVRRGSEVITSLVEKLKTLLK